MFSLVHDDAGSRRWLYCSHIISRIRSVDLGVGDMLHDSCHIYSQERRWKPLTFKLKTQFIIETHFRLGQKSLEHQDFHASESNIVFGVSAQLLNHIVYHVFKRNFFPSRFLHECCLAARFLRYHTYCCCHFYATVWVSIDTHYKFNKMMKYKLLFHPNSSM